MKSAIKFTSKSEDMATTSAQFKEDLIDFIARNQINCAVEFGTHRGYTTLALSLITEHVFTINRTEELLEHAKTITLKGRKNVTFIPLDLYAKSPSEVAADILECVGEIPIDLVFIDAGHSYEQVHHDIQTALRLRAKWICFDDYGMNIHHQVRNAIHNSVSLKEMDLVQFIGEPEGHFFGYGTDGTPRELIDSEGVIAKVK